MKANGKGKRHATQQSLNGAIKSICDVMRRSNRLLKNSPNISHDAWS